MMIVKTMNNNRVSIPGRIVDLLWNDDEFFREVASTKKVSSSGKFPRCDQWCDEEGFHMAFALAGYSPEDVSVRISSNELLINGVGSKLASTDSKTDSASDLALDDYPQKTPKPIVQRGMIVRGIARRNFKIKYFINPSFDLGSTQAFMRNGLLEVIVPRRSESLTCLYVEVEER